MSNDISPFPRCPSRTHSMAKQHIPLTYNVSRPVFKDKLEERQYVKERLALAYRVIAHEKICTRPRGEFSFESVLTKGQVKVRQVT